MLPTWDSHLNIDQYINPYLLPPAQALSRDRLLRLLGLQNHDPRRPIGNFACVIWAFVGTVGALSVISVIAKHIPAFQAAGTPLTIASFVSPLLI